jgi:hypothetical protein
MSYIASTLHVNTADNIEDLIVVTDFIENCNDNDDSGLKEIILSELNKNDFSMRNSK